MAKRKKTREQKILAEIHRRDQLTSQQNHNLVTSISSVKKERKDKVKGLLKTPSVNNSSTFNTTFNLAHDLKKTLLITLLIIIAQLILYFYIL